MRLEIFGVGVVSFFVLRRKMETYDGKLRS